MWDDVRVTPASLESQFCVLQSDESRRQPILESLCAELLESIDGLAEEEANIVRVANVAYAQDRAIYIPVVVTNAQLRVCQFDTGSISLTDGVIPEDKYQMVTVPFVRFRKSLAHAFSHDEEILNLQQANQARERTVFVANAKHLKDFLTDWQVNPMDDVRGFALKQLWER